MSRLRWLVLLGPPLVIAVAASATAATVRPVRLAAGPVAIFRPATPCPAGSGSTAGVTPAGASPAGTATGASTGTWWRSDPSIDRAGGLTGWHLQASGPDGRMITMDLPPASSASGPDRGRIVIAADDGARSSIGILDVARGCIEVLQVSDAVARRAIVDPLDGGFLVHLLARDTRADLGVWHVGVDGRRQLVLGPVAPRLLRDAGIDRVWATNLAVTGEGRRLAVQSCDPESCVTRILARDSGLISTLRGEHGDLLGFAGERLISMAACRGYPCDVLAWDETGKVSTLADGTVGAAVADDGLVVAAIPQRGAAAEVVAIDPATRDLHALGRLARETVPLAAGAAFGGVEAGPAAVGIIGPSGPPAILEVRP